MDDIAILRMADGMARHAASRHALVARNIANADTPGFRAQDLAPFESQMRAASGMKATRPTHLNAAETMRFEAMNSSARDAMSPNGNDVSLPDQVARSASAMGAHDRALAIYGKTMSILRAGLGRK